MIIYGVFDLNYQHDPIMNLGLEKYKDKISDEYVLILGLGSNGNSILPFNLHNDYNVKKWKSMNKKIIYLDFEEGSSFYQPFLSNNLNLYEYENICFKIFSICPYTCSYINERFNTNKRIFMPFFYNNDNIIKDINYDSKTNDVIYTGGINSITKLQREYSPIYTIYEVIHKYEKYIWIGGNANNYHAPSYNSKLKAYVDSKISIIHNVLCQDSLDETYLNIFKDTYHYKYTGTTKLVPQIKSRLFESAFNKCIILCYKDEYKSIEKLFKEGEDFLYWKTKEELQELIDKILNNYDNYKYLSENAFNKAINNYTTEKFIDNILIPNLN
jgi:hypothetical protein